MSLKQLPEPVQTFLSRNIRSVEQLEVLLFLREHQAQTYTATEVAAALYCHETSISRQLHALSVLGLCKRERREGGQAKFGYHPSSQEQADQVAEVAQAYEQRRVAVIRYIAEGPMDNVLALGRAFRLRDEEEP